MTTSIKDNSYILTHQDVFRGACARAKEAFSSIEGVIDVGFGCKQIKGEFTDDIVISIVVSEKKPLQELALSDQIPRTFEGYQTDVLVIPVGELLGCDNKSQYDIIQGGIQIGPTRKDISGDHAEGTLGCIVRRRGDTSRENVFLLTCGHVLFDKGAGYKDFAYHPFAPPPQKSIPSSGPSTPLGEIQKLELQDNWSYTYVTKQDGVDVSKTADFYIDCATAIIHIDSKCCGSTCTKDTLKYDETIIELGRDQNGEDPGNKNAEDPDGNRIHDVRSVIEDQDIITNGEIVYKVGRTTGKTAGKVRKVDSPVPVHTDPNDDNSPLKQAKNVIMIEFHPTPGAETNCHGHLQFAEKGDSGSLLVDAQNRVIGLVFYKTEHLAFACHILPVLDYLQICIPTTPSGTSHGSSHAVDGSGQAPAVSLGDSIPPDGQIVFTAQQTESAPTSAGFPDPKPLTDDELQRMQELLEAFRSTEKGRQLHAVFAEVRREIGYLVRNNRHVKVTWHRNKGPAFFAHFLKHLKGETADLPKEVDSVSLITLLTRMREILDRYGSNPLRRTLEEYGDELLDMLTVGNCYSVQDCIAYLQEREAV